MELHSARWKRQKVKAGVKMKVEMEIGMKVEVNEVKAGGYLIYTHGRLLISTNRSTTSVPTGTYELSRPTIAFVIQCATP